MCVVTGEYFMTFQYLDIFVFKIQLTLMSYCLETLSVLNVNFATDPVGTASTNTEKKYKLLKIELLYKDL